MTVRTVEPTNDAKAPAAAPPPVTPFAGKSLTRHLTRGAVGFGLIVGGIALEPVTGPLSLLGAPLGLAALRGCPMCWTIGLVQTVSRGRYERTCVGGVCALAKADPATKGRADRSSPSSP
jgi:hypothetical protein